MRMNNNKIEDDIKWILPLTLSLGKTDPSPYYFKTKKNKNISCRLSYYWNKMDADSGR
jgi:hypothetical protein